MSTNTPFSRWCLGLDGTDLILVAQVGCKIVDWVELDLRDLPRRGDLLCRLPLAAQKRLLEEAGV